MQDKFSYKMKKCKVISKLCGRTSHMIQNWNITSPARHYCFASNTPLNSSLNCLFY